MKQVFVFTLMLSISLLSGCGGGGGSGGGNSSAPVVNQQPAPSPTPAPTPTPSGDDFAIVTAQEGNSNNYLVSIEKISSRQIDFVSFEVNKTQGDYIVERVLIADIAGSSGNSLRTPNHFNVTTNFASQGLPNNKSLAKFRIIPNGSTTLPVSLDIKQQAMLKDQEILVNMNKKL